MFPIRDSIDYRGPAAATRLIILVNVAVFLWQILGGGEHFQISLYRHGFIPALFFDAPLTEATRLLTSIFMHGTIAHIGGNMWFLWVFGPSLEQRLGTLRYALFYLVAGIMANLIQGLFTAGSPIPVVGASGAISAVLGAYFILFRTEFIYSVFWFVLPFFVWVPVVIYLGYWALIQVLQAMSGAPGTAWWAHIGGFALGVIAARRWSRRRPNHSQTWY